MRLLVDEDVLSVLDVFTARHSVRSSVDVFGSGALDPVIRQYLAAQAEPEILITGDNDFAKRCRQLGSRLPCLWLHDLHDQDLARVTELLEVIEREAELLGPMFFMEIRAGSYHVQR
jgi:predicted nuclease of predicted toxin-antitoxin system